MNQRTTQLLLAAIAILLLAHLMQSTAIIPTIHADETANVSSILRAEAFELIDKQDKVVAMFHVGEDGGGNLRLRSGDGMVRVKLGATANGSGLILFDKEAEPAVHLATNETGTSATLAEKGRQKKVLKP